MSLVWGIVFLVAGLAGRFYIGRRKFNRRNVAGIEEYESYSSALANSAFDRIASIGSGILIFLGIVLSAGFFLSK